jgi:hypothetical protein
MDVCVVFVVRTVVWNVKWHEGRKDLNSTKMDQRGKTPGRQQTKYPGWGEIFRSRPDRPWGPTQPPLQWVPGLFPGGKAAGAWRWPPTLI